MAKYTITADSFAELREVFTEMFGDAAPTEASAGAEAAEQKVRRTRGPNKPKEAPQAPDPAPVPTTAAADDPFAPAAESKTAPEQSSDDPFATPTPAANPSVEKLIGRLEEKAKSIPDGENKVAAYAIKSLGLSPSLKLPDVFAALRGGNVPQDGIDALLKLTGGL